MLITCEFQVITRSELMTTKTESMYAAKRFNDEQLMAGRNEKQTYIQLGCETRQMQIYFRKS
jgi:hypothetical protein